MGFWNIKKKKTGISEKTAGRVQIVFSLTKGVVQILTSWFINFTEEWPKPSDVNTGRENYMETLLFYRNFSKSKISSK